MVRCTRLFAVLAPLGVLACTEATEVVPAVLLSLQVRPDQVRAGGAVNAYAHIINAGPDTLVLSSPTGCVGTLAIDRGDKPVDFDFVDSICPDIASIFRVPPLDSIVVHFGFYAWVARAVPPFDYASPPQPGFYTATFDSPQPLPDLRAEFQVTLSGYYFGWGDCGYAMPTSDSVIVVFDSVGARIWYEVWNFTKSVVMLTELGGARQPGSNAIAAMVQVKTGNGWEQYYRSSLAPYSYPVDLFINQCVRSVKTTPTEPGVYRLKIGHDAGFVVSDSIVITG